MLELKDPRGSSTLTVSSLILVIKGSKRAFNADRLKLNIGDGVVEIDIKLEFCLLLIHLSIMKRQSIVLDLLS
jgi:hypothetical protein